MKSDQDGFANTIDSDDADDAVDARNLYGGFGCKRVLRLGRAAMCS